MRPRVSGFSLIEALVAFALLAVALGVLLPEYSGPATRISARSDAALAHDYAQSRLARLSLAPELTDKDQQGDAFGWRWHDQISTVRLSGADEELILIKITIYDASGRTKIATAQGYQ